MIKTVASQTKCLKGLPKKKVFGRGEGLPGAGC